MAGLWRVCRINSCSKASEIHQQIPKLGIEHIIIEQFLNTIKNLLSSFFHSYMLNCRIFRNVTAKNFLTELGKHTDLEKKNTS
jgi:hypothetical protein